MISRSFVVGLFGVGCLLHLFACGSSSKRGGFAQPDAGDGPGDAGSGFETKDAGLPTDGSGCAAEAKLVYVLSLEGDLYSFAPADKAFKKIGALQCSMGAGKEYMPVSMAVDRKGIAWVNMRYYDNELEIGEDRLFKVDIKTAACSPSEIQGDFATMGGMGFSTNEGTKDKETLFINADINGKDALGAVDFARSKLTHVGDIREAGELTGTGDGRLYAFLFNSKGPQTLATVDKSTAGYSNRVILENVETPQAPMYAFSFWGGDFYVYTATTPKDDTTSNVARYRPSDGSIDTAYMKSIGFHIVGAGVSTCAPTSPPK